MTYNRVDADAARQSNRYEDVFDDGDIDGDHDDVTDTRQTFHCMICQPLMCGKGCSLRIGIHAMAATQEMA